MMEGRERVTRSGRFFLASAAIVLLTPSQKFSEEDGGSAGRLLPEGPPAAVTTGLTCISTGVLF